jgi:hypothetical protein
MLMPHNLLAETVGRAELVNSVTHRRQVVISLLYSYTVMLPEPTVYVLRSDWCRQNHVD